MEPVPSSAPRLADPPPPRILVSDFDGTMTRWDFYALVRKQWPLPPNDDPWEQYVAGWLADALSFRGEAFHHFEDWAELARILLNP
jgi:2-hydroxy-3-keto-5-methylthiopentenyl-1-phosphate phosphatase